MALETYYRDHWVTIEPERLQRYGETFRITDANRPMFVDPLGAQSGEVVLDFGCGPGYVADASIPLEENSLDRAVFKSVLLYVPEVATTLVGAHRALRPGGHVVTQDTDMWLSACTVFTREEWRGFQDAMGPAFRDPTMGRHLPGALKAAGFTHITTQVSAFADDQGFFRSTLENFIGYTTEVETLTAEEAAEMGRRADEAIEAGDWLFVLNFFQVNGRKAGG